MNNFLRERLQDEIEFILILSSDPLVKTFLFFICLLCLELEKRPEGWLENPFVVPTVSWGNLKGITVAVFVAHQSSCDVYRIAPPLFGPEWSIWTVSWSKVSESFDFALHHRVFFVLLGKLGELEDRFELAVE